MNLVVVGSIGLDDVETPFGKIDGALGGSAIYFSLAAAPLAQTGLVGVVGTDFPEAGTTVLREHGVDLAGLDVVEGKTFRWGGHYTYDLNDRTTLFTELNVLEHFQPTLPDEYKSVDYLFLGNIHPDLQLQVLEQVKNPKFVAMDTMNFWIEGTPEPLARVLARVDALLINDSEARELAGTPNLVEAMKKIEAMGPKLIIIKRGEYGAVLYQGGEFFFAPAFPLPNVVDPTGAGDSFAGGFMGYLAMVNNLEWSTLCQAVVAGSTMASFCVEKFSVERLAELGLDDVNGRLATFSGLTSFEPLPTIG